VGESVSEALSRERSLLEDLGAPHLEAARKNEKVQITETVAHVSDPVTEPTGALSASTTARPRRL